MALPHAAGVVVLEADATHVFATWRELFVIVWRAAPTVPFLEGLSTRLSKFASQQPNGISMIVVVEARAELPDQSARDRMAIDMKQHETFTHNMALVYEGTGFLAAALRGVVAALTMASRQKVRTKVVSTVDEAALWLADVPPFRARADEVTRAVAAARAAPTTL